jgi:hypothetical protein
MLREGFGVEFYSRVQLRAVFSGVAVAIGALAIFLGLSWAIGLSTFEPTASRAHGLALGIIIWGAVALALSILVGAYVAALVGRSAEARDGILHGLVVWGTLGAVLFLVFMSLFSGVMHDLMIATGGDLATSGEAAPRLDEGERAVVAQAARDAAGILWVYWSGIVGGLATAVIGGWLGARAEHGALARHTEEERPPIGPVLPHPTGA